MGKYPGALVQEARGKPSMYDADVLAFAKIIRAEKKKKCGYTLELHAYRVPYFKQRLTHHKMTAEERVILIVNVNDTHGEPLANVLMPEENWQKFRDEGKIPFVRSLVDRKMIQEYLEFFDREAEAKLKDMTGVAIVVIDHGVAEVFPA
jgi:hypothetical protein